MPIIVSPRQWSKWAESMVCIPGRLQVPADEQFHDFRSTSVDAADAGVGEDARNRIFAHVAVAAEQLQALVDDAALALGGPQLGHGALLRSQGAGDDTLQALVQERPAHGEIGLDLG